MQFSGKEAKAGTDKSGDALVTLELPASGGIDCELVSKVSSKYGAEIRAVAEQVLAAHGVQDARLLIEDFGALDFVIAARIETALFRLRGRGAE